jgi:hypothetical protein
MISFKKLCEMAYPVSFSFEEFDTIPSYGGKIKYATQHLQRMASGSSRVIFKIDDEKVLKVAKNIKGLAQNNTEQDYTIQQWYGDIVAKVFKIGDTIKDEGPFYLEMELAKKINPNRFKQLLGFSLQDLDLHFKHLAFLHKKSKYDVKISPEQIEYFNNQEFVQQLWDMIQNFDMTFPGDFTRANTYGEVLRNGVPTIVLIDFGLSNQVWLDYYAKN